MLPLLFEPVCQHIGHKHATQFQIDPSKRDCWACAHDTSSEHLAAVQQLAVDLADFVQDFARLMIIGQKLRCLLGALLRHVIHLRPLARIADREIVLGTMTGTAGTFASRLATRLVSLDK